MRKGIAMIMAIAFLVIIAGMMATMMNMSTVTTKRTENMYFKEQAQLLAKSATEFAVLAISGHNKLANTNCVTNIASQFGAPAYFNIQTTIRYIGLPGAPIGSTCANYINTPLPLVPATNIAPESQGTVLIDVFVTSIDAQLNLNQPVAFHRRTLQKP